MAGLWDILTKSRAQRMRERAATAPTPVVAKKKKLPAKPVRTVRGAARVLKNRRRSLDAAIDGNS